VLGRTLQGAAALVLGVVLTAYLVRATAGAGPAAVPARVL
jgi:hypothetical protein